MSSESCVDLSQRFRILIASDIHLGFNEKHYERGKDSFTTFEEVLILAKDEGVDLILLGGDLFHLNKPSFKTQNKAIELLRGHCMGVRPIQFEIVSNQSQNFGHNSNISDENLNISVPVFTIHGNHDDPTGHDHLSVLDTIASAGHINYFGKYTKFDELLLKPILLQKGDSKIALFGLGSLHELRLNRIVTEGKLKYSMPENEKQWFKIVVLHQNRIPLSQKKYLPEKCVSSSPNLVIWGHEHKAIREPDYNHQHDFYIYQPGSTVATSLCEGENLAKQCAILEVYFDNKEGVPRYKLERRLLKTVRPFVWQTLDIPDLISQKRLNLDEIRCISDVLSDYCKQKVEEMIESAKLQHTGHERQPTLPLIRLRLEYSDEKQQFNSAEFGDQFNGRVANHSEIIRYVKRKEDHNYENDDTFNIKDILDQEVIEERVNITQIIGDYFKNNPSDDLGLLSEKCVTPRVIECAEKESYDAINSVFDAEKERFKKCLLEMENFEIVDKNQIKELIRNIKNSSDDTSPDLVQTPAESPHRISNGVDTEPITAMESDTDFGTNNRMDVHSDEQTSVRGSGRVGATKRDSLSRPRTSTETTLDFVPQPSTSGGRLSPQKPATKRLKFISDSD